MVVPNEGRELEGLQAILLEAKKKWKKTFGFTNSELERAKTNLLKSIENSCTTTAKIRKNSNLVREYVRHLQARKWFPLNNKFKPCKCSCHLPLADMVNQMRKATSPTIIWLSQLVYIMAK